jgi:apolipoprotein N-acyltransferase
LVAVVGGVALALSFPGVGWWPMAPIGVAAISVASRGRRPGPGLLLGLAGGLAFFVPHLHWSGVYVGWLPWIALATLEASFVAVLGALLPLAWRAPGGRAGTVVATAGLWTGQEALRGRLPFGGFPWGRLAFSQSDAPTLGYAALGGAPLISAAVALAGGGLAVAAVELLARRSDRRWVTAPAATLASLAVITGGALVPTPTDGPRSAEVAAVQGNVPAPGLDFNAHRMAVLSNHVLATARIADRSGAGRVPRPDLVLWPENASDIDPLRNQDAAMAIQAAADRVGVPVLVGGVLEQPTDHLSNAAVLWGPTGSTHPGPGVTYVKRHPAPFAEYIPYRSFFRIFSDKVDLVRRDFTAGDRVGVFPAGDLRIGDVICFEVTYDSLVRDPVRSGADLLVVQTNNATFGFTDESVQQLAMSRVRAVESGRAVVHISTVGVSALIAPDGRLLARSGHFTQEVLQSRLPLRTGRTVATQSGAAPEAALSALGLLLAVGALLRRRRTVDPVPAQPDRQPRGSVAPTPSGGTA